MLIEIRLDWNVENWKLEGTGSEHPSYRLAHHEVEELSIGNAEFKLKSVCLIIYRVMGMDSGSRNDPTNSLTN